MRCTSPRTVGFYSDGKTICWSPKHYDKQYATFQLPCSKCIACRLEYARQWAVRCVHEAQMHENNSFITLTYSDEHLKSPKLIYKDFQDFMKRLRHSEPHKQISVFVTGEYGDKTKRPHWHAIIFNWRPSDSIHKYTNDRGDKVYSSAMLDRLWSFGITELGSVTFESAGYCARYAAKKLSHGHDLSHDFHPISKKSSKYAIGKSFIEKYYESVFDLGAIVLPDGQLCSIPRYYEKWLQKHRPEVWRRYVTQLKAKRTSEVIAKNEKEKRAEYSTNMKRAPGKGPQISKNKVLEAILKQKFSQLQKHLKL